MEAFLFSANSVLPVFMVILLGTLLKRFHIITDNFVDVGTRLTFRVALPCMLFLNIAESDISQVFDWQLLAFTVGGTLLLVLLLCWLTPRFIRDPATSAAFIQGSFRGNLVVVGMALTANIGGQLALAKLAMTLSVFAPLYNVLGVLVLAGAHREQGRRQIWHSIYTNPLLLAAVAASVFSLLHLELPQLLYSPLNMVGQSALPLSLLLAGGAIEISRGDANLRRASAAAIIKVLVQPLLMLLVAAALGFRGADLVLILVIFGSPTANASFPMAYQMGADYKLASLIIVFSNLYAIFTIFAFTYGLRALMLI
jgi:predicted permease